MAPMLAARPTAMVETSDEIRFIVSIMARPASTEPPGLLMYTVISSPGASASIESSIMLNTAPISSVISPLM